ncbi:MAG: hypothetical protein LKF30_05620 [Sphingobium sp.]|nr:hypothetical protein [Sphingobium sp.]MCI1757341.1 hypothetical protein [Sphingobium sp.]MCI2053173.1 hypothetical protein [Sphingobium sp.]
MIDEPSNESVVPAHPELGDADQLSGEGAFDSVAYHECISQIDSKLDDLFSASPELGVQQIHIDIPSDEETQRLVSAELLFRLERRLEESGFKIVLLDGQFRQDGNGRVVKFQVYNISKFAIIGKIEVLSDINATNLPAIWVRKALENARLHDRQLEQERLDALKATLTQAFEQSGLSEDKRETFLRETFGVIAKLQTPEPMAQAERPLCLPEAVPELYQGKGKSGEIYAFLQRVYPYREGAMPLTTAFLRENDPIALQAFKNRRRNAPPPTALLSLMRGGQPSTMQERLAAHGVDISTPEGVADAKKLASAITKLVYAPN